MLKNYLRTSLRTLARYRGYAVINILGLAVGIACCLLILLFVRHELSYDRFHERADRIQRVTIEFQRGPRQMHLPVTPSVVAPLFIRTFPEVENAVRFYHAGRSGPLVVRHEDVLFQEERFWYADSTVFDIFSFPLLAGDPQTALTRPHTIVLTETTARKYFGDADPIGQTLLVDDAATFEVSGVIADVPDNAHFQFDFLASLTTRAGWSELNDEQIRAANFFTYLLLGNAGEAASLSGKIPGLVEQITREVDMGGMTTRLFLQPLTDIHLYSNFERDMGPQGDIAYVLVFSAIALLILLVACVNYMNLATARSARRAREVGVRKVMGATRSQLTWQFFAESALMTILGLGLGLILVALLLPGFNGVVDKQLAFSDLGDPMVLLGILGVGLFVSFVAGSYPALFLSSFQPVKVLKGEGRTGMAGAFVRKGLVVFQFAISVFLIIGTLAVFKQIDYIQHKRLGFDKEQVVVLPIGDQQLLDRYETLKREMVKHSNVYRAAVASDIPGYVVAGYSAWVEGMPEEESQNLYGLSVDTDFVETLGLELVQGRGFPETYSVDLLRERGHVFMLNETAVARMGLEGTDLIGKRLNMNGREGELVGVVKDFHFTSLRQQIEPLALFFSPWDFEYLLVKVGPNDLPGTLAYLEQQWKTLAPHRPFEYEFLDEAFDALYKTEMQTGRLLGSFALLAILIACLGLFGLAAFTAEQRTKEIGVRKVMGASVPGILMLLSRDFAQLVFIGFLIAVPVAYFVMNGWLEDFAYRTELSAGSILLAGGAVLFIAVLTVSYQSLRAALANPIDAIRHE